MSFALPGYLLLLPIGGLVVLMHLLRPRRKDATVSSLMLWMSLAQRIQSQSLGRRLAEFLLVLVRASVAVLTVLALARPLVPGLSSPANVVVVLDSSASMLVREDGGATRFDNARDQAMRFLEGLKGRPLITVVQAGPRPETLLARARSRRSALAALARARASEARADLDLAIDMVFSTVKPGEHDVVAVFTDGAFDTPAFTERFRAAGAPSLRVFKAGSPSAWNVGITSFEFRADPRGPGDAEGFIAISNFSPEDAEVDVRVSQDDRVLASSRVRVPAAGTSGLAFAYPEFEGTVCTARISPGGDLGADDVAYAVFPSDVTVSVLMVGEVSPSLARAMRAIPRTNVRMASPGLASLQDLLASADIAVYNNVDVDRVVSAGAILIEPRPAGGTSQDVPGPASPVILDHDRTHPVMRFVDLSRVTIEKAPGLPAPPAARVLVDSSQGALVWALESPGQRIVAFSFDPEDSDLVDRPGFPIMVRNIVGWLAPHKVDLSRATTRCGDSVTIRVKEGSRTIGITDPAGRLTRIYDPAAEIVFGETLYAGLYTIQDRGGERLFAANLVSPEESNPSPRAVFPEQPESASGKTGADRERPDRVDATPALLVAALALIVLEWGLTLRGRGPRLASTLARGRKWPGHALKALCAASLLLVLAGVAIPVPSAVRNVMIAADRSGSMSLEARRAQEEFIRASMTAMNDPDTLGVVAFGERAYLEREPGPRGPEFSMSSRPGEVETDIESALRVALQALPPGPGRRIVLFSDGNETVGNALAAATEAASAGVPVDVVVPGEETDDDVAVTSFVAPETVSPGEPFELRIAVTSTRATSAALTIHRDSALALRQEVSLSAGRNVFILPEAMERPGVSVFSCRVTAGPVADRRAENNVAFAYVTAWSKPRVLLASSKGAAGSLLAAVLEAADMEITAVPPDGVPALPEIAGYDLLVLDDVPATALSASQMSAVANYVRHLGGGLMAIGGRGSFGLGGYRGTPLEDVLPVWSDVRERVAFPSLAAVIVLDRSGSMATAQGGMSKLDLAREAAYSVVELMNETDMIGVLAFDTESFWAVPIRSAGEREEIAQGLSTLVAEGGTSMYPALVEAHSKLVATPAMVRHLVVLSDGVSASADFEEVCRKIASDGITVTTVAVGQDSDIELMKNIADWGRGRAYYTDDIYAIPQILTTEALVMSRSLAVEAPFIPSPGAPAPFLADIEWEECPQLEGYVAASLKGQASAHLVSPVGDPVLASWHVGLGRSVAFTSSAGPPWGARWSPWKGAARMWAQAARWAQRLRDPGMLSATARVERGVGRLAVDAVAEDGTYVDFASLAATVLMPDGTSQAVRLDQVGPGRYEGAFDAPRQGVYLAAVAPHPAGSKPEDVSGVALAGAVFSYPEEYGATGTNLSLLQRIAATTHGRILAPDDVAFGSAGRALVLRRPTIALLLAALALFIAYLVLVTVPSDFPARLRGVVDLARIRVRRAGKSAGANLLPEERYEDLVWATTARPRREEVTPAWTGSTPVDDRGLDYATRVYFARLRKERRRARERS